MFRTALCLDATRRLSANARSEVDITAAAQLKVLRAMPMPFVGRGMDPGLHLDTKRSRTTGVNQSWSKP